MSRVRECAPAALVLVLGLVLWEAVVVAFSIEFYLLPAPHVIVASLGETYPVLVEAGLYTFTEAVLGWTLGCGGGILVAMAASRSSAFAELVLPYAVASASVPIIALAPLAIVWFGVEQGSKIAIVVLVTFFPTSVGTLRGLLSTTPQSLELMRSRRSRR